MELRLKTKLKHKHEEEKTHVNQLQTNERLDLSSSQYVYKVQCSKTDISLYIFLYLSP